MNLRSQKQLAARILKCGITRVRLKTENDVEEAITREDIRNLIKKGLIWKVQKRGQARAFSRKRASQKRRGRKRGPGSRKGRKGARNPGKREWIRTIRSVRSALKGLKESGMIEARAYRRLYLMAKGGTFKSRRHLILYLKDHELLKAREKPVKRGSLLAGRRSRLAKSKAGRETSLRPKQRERRRFLKGARPLRKKAIKKIKKTAIKKPKKKPAKPVKKRVKK